MEFWFYADCQVHQVQQVHPDREVIGVIEDTKVPPMLPILTDKHLTQLLTNNYQKGWHKCDPIGFRDLLECLVLKVHLDLLDDTVVMEKREPMGQMEQMAMMEYIL